MLRRLPKVPLRPFQSPPTIVDCTGDAQYELKWAPLYANSQLSKERKKLNKDEMVAGGYIHDEKALGADLFDNFYD